MNVQSFKQPAWKLFPIPIILLLEAVSYSNYIPLSENIYQVCLHLNYTSEQ